MEIRRRRRPGRPRPGPGFRAKLGGETAGGEGFRLGSRIGASLDAVRVGGVRFCWSPGLRPAVGDGPPAPAGMGGQDAMVKVNHPIYRVRGFEIVGPYVLHVAFDDGTVQTIDFEPVLAGETLRTAPRSGSLSAGPARSRGPYARLAERCRFRSGHAARLARPRASVHEPGAQLGDGRASLRLRKPDRPPPAFARRRVVRVMRRPYDTFSIVYRSRNAPPVVAHVSPLGQSSLTTHSVSVVIEQRPPSPPVLSVS